MFGGIGLVLVAVVVLVVVAVTSGGGGSGSNATPLASASVLRQVEGVSPATMATQAKNNPPLAFPVPTNNKAVLTASGKPKVVYIGAEYCPYCGGERWAMIMALSKFGTFTGVKQITSSSSDNPAAIPTFSFLGSSYRSPYLVFDPAETQKVDRSPLQTPTKANAALEAKYDAPPYTQSGGIPFVYIGGKWVIDGASYDVSPMQHLSHATVAQAAATGSTKYGADIQSTAGAIVSRLCNLTGGNPGNV
ncbi:MAG: DUF929 family protein, partial [Acidimicrobiaceae bacterium]|nr:DUF929 family protein [Acidimicrobiaceae bacterium]